ncbi:deoxyhypusine hydroxylase nero [Brevipalpus obovatus]|uniref:deoxyhypusine hydroxylase nero n=1 Tax=Brevipalpus obovatus TaxID=246614 RepID=UPI003D9E76C7
MKVSNSVSIDSVGAILADTQQPLKRRFRALFTLKNTYDPQSLPWIKETLDKEKSVLLKHELAYCMGQMSLPEAIPLLIPILNDHNQDSIVRHEAGEALGNLVPLDRDDDGNNRSLSAIKALEANMSDKCPLVSQTCELAMEKIRWLRDATKQEIEQLNCKKFTTHDPTPPMASFDSVGKLEEILISPETSLFDKYRALFSLRNLGSSECVDILGRSLHRNRDNRKMDLFMHEIGYIFGQMCDPDSIEYLEKIVEYPECHEIARHECVEALGSIGTSKAIEFLKNFINDPSLVVRQSVEVALDMTDYTEDDSFQFWTTDRGIEVAS